MSIKTKMGFCTYTIVNNNPLETEFIYKKYSIHID